MNAGIPNCSDMREGRMFGDSVEATLELVDDLLEIIASENSMLAAGMPASASQSLAEKFRLAREFERQALAIRAGALALESRSERARLAERARLLQAAMDENVNRLGAAIEATRRRVNAVMRAVREQVSAPTAYQANGRAWSGVVAHGALGGDRRV